MRVAGDAPVTVRRLSPPTDHHEEMRRDVATGMQAMPRSIPSKYFYDATGSDLFEQITRTPEYYLTRIETMILERHAGDLLARTSPDELIELGSGSSRKTRLLIEAMRTHAPGRHYVPIDISEDALRGAALALCGDYTWLAIDGLVGDFHRDLPLVPRRGRRLVAFLGSTIGNFDEDERRRFLLEVRSMLDDGDHLLLGVDLVKDAATMVAAYDDAAGLTSRFTRNILKVVNRVLHADFPVADFTHEPIWRPDRSRMEAWLRATRPVSVTIADIPLVADITEGEALHTEVSCKFTRGMVEADLAATGLALEAWCTDDRDWFALVLARPV